MAEYCRESEILTIYHIGTHKCLLRQNTKEYRLWVIDAVLKNSGLAVCSIQQAEVGEAVAAGDIQEAQRRAM